MVLFYLDNILIYKFQYMLCDIACGATCAVAMKAQAPLLGSCQFKWRTARPQL